MKRFCTSRLLWAAVGRENYSSTNTDYIFYEKGRPAQRVETRTQKAEPQAMENNPHRAGLGPD